MWRISENQGERDLTSSECQMVNKPFFMDSFGVGASEVSPIEEGSRQKQAISSDF